MLAFVSYKNQLSLLIKKFFKKKKQILDGSYFSADVFSRLSSLSTNGKMLRGSLLINTYEKFTSHKSSVEVLNAAVALELAQTAFLIHDDVFDQDELRRAQPTLHYQYKNLAIDKKYRQALHFGESLAICAGDLVLLLVFELLEANLIKIFSQYLSRTALGQMQDVELSLMNGENVTKDQILQMYKDKTASYSVCLPLLAGAVLAKENDDVLVQLSKLGEIIGLIFQIKDDEIGLFGDTAQTGKPVGADIREGKKSLHYFYLLKEVGVEVEDKSVKEILELMTDYELRQKVNLELKELIIQANQQIEQLRVNPEVKQMLAQFLEIVTNRVR